MMHPIGNLLAVAAVRASGNCSYHRAQPPIVELERSCRINIYVPSDDPRHSLTGQTRGHIVRKFERVT